MALTYLTPHVATQKQGPYFWGEPELPKTEDSIVAGEEFTFVWVTKDREILKAFDPEKPHAFYQPLVELDLWAYDFKTEGMDDIVKTVDVDDRRSVISYSFERTDGDSGDIKNIRKMVKYRVPDKPVKGLKGEDVLYYLNVLEYEKGEVGEPVSQTNRFYVREKKEPDPITTTTEKVRESSSRTSTSTTGKTEELQSPTTEEDKKPETTENTNTKATGKTTGKTIATEKNGDSPTTGTDDKTNDTSSKTSDTTSLATETRLPLPLPNSPNDADSLSSVPNYATVAAEYQRNFPLPHGAFAPMVFGGVILFVGGIVGLFWVLGCFEGRNAEMPSTNRGRNIQMDTLEPRSR